tara:strand:- start:10923 stop:11297 length:375 start_codon:yes stop_codon:yes gene_type:complete
MAFPGLDTAALVTPSGISIHVHRLRPRWGVKIFETTGGTDTTPLFEKGSLIYYNGDFNGLVTDAGSSPGFDVDSGTLTIKFTSEQTMTGTVALTDVVLDINIHDKGKPAGIMARYAYTSAVTVS